MSVFQLVEYHLARNGAFLKLGLPFWVACYKAIYRV